MNVTKKAPNQFLQADRGDSAGKIGLRSLEGGSDPRNDLSPPTAAEKCVGPQSVERMVIERQNRKRLIRTISLLLVAILLIGCQQTISSTPEREEHTAFKGIELYSWLNKAGEWEYSILPGTNRYKTIDEVKLNPMSLDDVKIAIAKMAVNESIFWSTKVYDNNGQIIELAYPAKEVVEELKQYALVYQVKLNTP